MDNQQQKLGKNHRDIDEGIIKQNMEDFRLLAIKLGASDAKIIPAKVITVDERVRLKCLIPRCGRAGETPNCPPNVPDLDVIRRAFALYTTAILFKCDVRIDEIQPGKEMSETGKMQLLHYHKKGIEIAAALERQAFKDGYHLAMGLGGGSCKDYLCEGAPCQYLQSGSCRFPLQSRPSIEAMGIDATKLINDAGWASYALLDDLSKVPGAITVGLVFVY